VRGDALATASLLQARLSVTAFAEAGLGTLHLPAEWPSIPANMSGQYT
jgi:hypothetical protein